MKSLLAALFTLLLLASTSGEASAQEYTRRSYVLPKGSLELTGNPARPLMMGVDISDNSDNDLHFPVHVYFGVTKDLTLGITHDRGLCPNCDEVYNDIGLGLLYGIVRDQSFELDLHLTAPLFNQFDPEVFLSVRGGVLGRVNFGSVVAMVFDPSLKIGLSNRADEDGNNKEYLDLPIWFYFQATKVIVPFAGTSFRGPLEDLFDNVQVPLEGGMVFSVTQNIDLGFVITFWNLFGNGGDFDFREIGFVGRFRFM